MRWLRKWQGRKVHPWENDLFAENLIICYHLRWQHASDAGCRHDGFDVN